ncbi:MAG: acyl-CoA dehydrogenase family protein [Acidobacteriota bacterium]
MGFTQSPPRLENQYVDDRMLRSSLARLLPPPLCERSSGELEHLGELAAGELFTLQQADRVNEPVLTQWDAWGERIDRIELTPLWRRAAGLAAEHGLVATAYDSALGEYARAVQMAKVYLFAASTDMYACPLAMTDGAARTLLTADNRSLIDRAVPRLLSRDPACMWTSGQWMTETTGGSDVGRSETEARCSEDGRWRLWGRKWFTSATTAEMAITLARPVDNPAGSRGLAAFYVETRDAEGRLQGLEVQRLKDKLGTRKVPTAELRLCGVHAIPLAGLDRGTRVIAPMLNVTRLWNSVTALALMRRGIALARVYARQRVVFGARLVDKPLHRTTLGVLQAELEASFQLVFRVVTLLGRVEAGTDADGDVALLRLLTPIVKLLTGKQAVKVLSEVLEAFGGAGYVEDTGLPVLLRDAQVLPIWEGTTNVLSLDVIRALRDSDGLKRLQEEIDRALSGIGDEAWLPLTRMTHAAFDHALAWVSQATPEHLEAGARAFALTLGRATALALLIEHARWEEAVTGDGRAAAAARIFARSGIDLIVDDEEPTSVRRDLEALADDRRHAS